MTSRAGHVAAVVTTQPQSTREGVFLRKPHPLALPSGIPLTIPLPSPRPLVGTPFDPSPRYEYPFPTPHTSSPMPYHPSIHDYHPSLVFPMPAMRTSSNALSAPPARPQSASKRIMAQPPRAPPVPPGLAKRRGTIDSNGSTPNH
ncbi:hypothetical protein OF83DRAFT_1131505 [Amylostereum chailletii]|nr:hypothetical protein OF83DRAFT_1131505 [Amylostereum chailletii]